MKIAIIMMQKNEGQLIKDWVEYHSSLVGRENLYVFDNGSTDQHTISILREYEAQGLNIDFSKSKKEHFIGKGRVILEKIRTLEESEIYDYFFPMDCDEFLACLDDKNELSIDIGNINEVLAGLAETKEVLAIKHAYSDSPIHDDYYLPQRLRKTFFKANTCAFLDEGFHNGKTHDTDVKVHTRIVYFHLHNKPHADWLKAAKEKLRERISDFSKESLQAFLDRKGPGCHLVPKMLMSETEFNDFYKVDGRVYFPEFKKKIQRSRRGAFDNPIAEPFSQDRPLVGYIDKIRKSGSILTLSGWGYMNSGDPIGDFIPVINGTRRQVWALSRTNRSDVQEKYPDAPDDCGFILQVKCSEGLDRLEVCCTPDEKGLHHTLRITKKANKSLSDILS